MEIEDAAVGAHEERETDIPLDGQAHLLSRALGMAQLGSWEWEISSDRVVWSVEMYRILGYQPGSVTPSMQLFVDCLHPEDRPLLERRLVDALRTPGCFELECRIRADGGPERSVHCRAEVLSDADGNPARIIGTAHDVTELRRESAQLETQVEQLQQLAEASVAIYAAEGLEETLEAATSHALRIVGAARARGSIAQRDRPGEALVYLADDDGIDPDAAELLAAFEPLHHPIRLSRGQVDRHPQLADLPEDVRALARQGWMVVPLADILGGATGSIQLFEKAGGDFTDNDEALVVQVARITSLALQKSRLFDDLLLSEDRYRRLFNAHLSGDFVLSADGTFVDVNVALVRILGYPSVDDLKGLNVREVYHNPAELERVVTRIREKRRAFQQETELTRADGSTVFVIVNLVGLFDRQGEMLGLQGCLFDVTEWKAAEAALLESQQQLLQAQKMEAVGQLAGGIAHDFNNMLTAIQGFADLLEEEVAGSASGQAYLREIRNAANRSAGLTRQLLAYSRKQVLQPEVIELNGVVAGMEDMLKRLIGEHIQFLTMLDPETGRVNADPSQLQQVLMNLVLNARDAIIEKGRLMVRTCVERVETRTDMGDFILPPGDYAVLTVTDNGRGMPKEVLSRVFEPFFTTKAVGLGSGLGLSTVYGIVKQSGGFIHAASTVGEGTTFTILLPRTRSGASERGPVAPQPGVNDVVAKGRVLVAEDETVLRTLAATVLRRNGFEVVEAEDGLDALQKAAGMDYDIDVLVTDVVMPQIGGEQLATSLLEHRPHLPIVFMSGYAEEVIARQGLLTSGSVFLEKPFPPKLLVRAVHEVFGMKV